MSCRWTQRRRWCGARDRSGGTCRQVQAALEAGAPMSADAEKVASSTEIQRALRAENERRLRAGSGPVSDDGPGRAARHGAGPRLRPGRARGPVEQPRGREHRRQRRRRSCSSRSPAGWSRSSRRSAAHARGVLGPDPPGRPPAGRGRGAVRRPPPEAGPAAAGRVTHVRRLRRRGHERRGGARPTCASAVTGSWSRRSSELVELGVWPAKAATFVVAALAAGENVIVAGDWASGKTTMLRALIYSAVPPWERVVTVEAAITELGLHRSGRFENVVALFSARPGTGGRGRGDGVGPHGGVHPPPERHASDRRRDFGQGGRPGAGHVHLVDGRKRLHNPCPLGPGGRRPLRAVRHGGQRRRCRPRRCDWRSPTPCRSSCTWPGTSSTEGEVRRYCTSICEVTGLEDGQVAMTELWGLDERGQLVPAARLVSIAPPIHGPPGLVMDRGRLGRRSARRRAR